MRTTQASTPFIFIAALVSLIDIVLGRTDIIARQSGLPPVPSLTPVGPYVFTDGIPGCTNGPDTSFSFTWTLNTSMNAPICGVGWKTGTNRTISFQGYYSASGYGLFQVYGWTREPMVEYIVAETWGYLNPAAGDTFKGTVTCGDSLYDIYQGLRFNRPGIDGDIPSQPYTGIWSVRRKKRYGAFTGTVDMDCHFKAWNSFGLELGTHDYQLVSALAYYSSGNVTAEIVP
ncbi:hypothetical protein CVT24_012903 [Panaeolus cyanescens]|uniref:Endo-1,4-beta-xylanase n=1 Tax=Panaeolus cyanescens TaxID=181874 RepID=A0A409W2T6_9AGAR|nr:hypothetical protein CVT24_012903 [Panaeolus cyanescens]